MFESVLLMFVSIVGFVLGYGYRAVIDSDNMRDRERVAWTRGWNECILEHDFTKPESIYDYHTDSKTREVKRTL